jgi:membrane protease YdiL (CAAX protease family)
VLIALTFVATLFLGVQVLSEFIRNIGLILPTYLITLIVGILLGPLWEEPGWRGFALPRLQASYGALLGTVILGVLWALWHLPGYAGGWMTASLVAVLLSSVAFSIIMTWVYNNTRGSILLMILLHSSSNAALTVGVRVLPTNLTGSMNTLVYGGWVPVITYSIIAIIVIAATRGRLSYQKSELATTAIEMQTTPQS